LTEIGPSLLLFFSKEVNSDEETGRGLIDDGDCSVTLVWMRRNIQRYKNKMPQMWSRFYRTRRGRGVKEVKLLT